MNSPDLTMVQSAERILVPSGRDYGPCVAAFQGMYDIDVPEFPGRQLVVKAGGRRFAKFKGKDIPEKIAADDGDIGLTGTDVCGECLDPDRSNLEFVSIGPPMCSFDILAATGDINRVWQDLIAGREKVTAATGLPKLLGELAAARRLNLVVAPIPLNGSVEAAVEMGWSRVVADIVQTGGTSRDNGLAKVTSLMDIEPAIVWRDTDREYFPALSASGIRSIDATLTERSLQMGDLAITSYSLELLRDQNEAVKKFGSEGAEVLQAVLAGESVSACESEIADLLFAASVLARGRGIPVRIENVLRILEARNRSSEPPRYRRDPCTMPRH